MERIKEFLNQRKVPGLLLVVLAMSVASNLYLYFGVIKPIQEKPDVQTEAWLYSPIQAGMGWMRVFLSRGLMVGRGQKFNVTVGVKLWEPYIGSKTYNFSFKIYNRTLNGEYPEAPIVEKSVVVHKDKDSMYIHAASGNLTVTVPPSYTPEIYIYKAGFGIQYYIEFAITTATSGPVLLP